MTDARAFAAIDYDYLIIGAGAGGLAVATRLSEKEELKIGIIEAGTLHEADPIIDIPANVGKASGNPLYDWSFETIPQPGAAGRSITLPRGKMVGGSTGINNMAWTRASRPEYDAWELFGPNSGWNWEGLLPYMKQSTNVFPDQTNLPIVNVKLFDPKFEGLTGPVSASFNSWYSDVFPAYLSAANSSGISPNFGSDEGTTTGLSNCRSNVERSTGTRSYAAPAYYCSHASRPNFHVLVNSQVCTLSKSPTRASSSNSYTATGVEFFSNNITYTAQAKKEVILAAGTIQSPQILELSGIGNSSILQSVGIEPLIDLPQVGENMQDHLFAPAQYRLKPGITTFDALRINETVTAEQAAIYAQNGSGMLSGTDTALSFLPLDHYADSKTVDSLKHTFDAILGNNSSSTFRRTQYEVQRDWLQQGHVPQSEIIMWSRGAAPLANESYITLLSGVLHPASRGSVHIKSKDPLDRPTIDAGWLMIDFDVLIILQTLKFAMKIATREPLASMIDGLVIPLPDVHNDTALINFIRENAASASHLMGTVAMAPRGIGGVLDNSLTVYGTTNLRVCDASTLPNGIGTHLQSTIYAIGEKLADIIKEHD
ncbi:alcohol oxidase [Lentinula aciculospora]|uniref:Alcohol oxidase n=1 Tax=Lentinula aciculospora TaxID=153920 RepID=A0A9W9AAS1_9AGAR|nr:alcohol oxidase [Lentinula aciculospora]KAJ4487584.1 alcohol oxidase [Lentinula aciculospora]